MTMTRDEALICAGPRHHAAHLSLDDASLVEAIVVFSVAALDRGEAVALIATDDHLRGVRAGLKDQGWAFAGLVNRGQLVCLDAAETLARIMDGEHPNRAAFDAVIRPVITAARSRFAGVAAFGELVNILWHEGNRQAAHTLEQWWNDLIAEYGFSLLCGYRVDPFDFQESVQEGIADICATHTHVLPVEDCDRFEAAVDAAMRQVFQNGDALALRRHLHSRCRRRTNMPPAQAVLLALRDILPSLAQEVRMIARDHYRRAQIRPALKPQSAGALDHPAPA